MLKDESKVVQLNDSKDEEIIDVEIKAIKKKRIRLNGDYNKVIELNTSDLSIMNRVSEVYPKLNKLALEGATDDAYLADDSDEEAFKAASEKLAKIDGQIREVVDYIFDYPVSAVCADNGTMLDPVNGSFRFEHIIETLLGLYEQSFTQEYKKIADKMKKHTSKYSKKRK